MSSASSVQSATMVAPATATETAALPIIPMHLHHQQAVTAATATPVSQHHPPPPPPPTLALTSDPTNVSSSSSSASVTVVSSCTTSNTAIQLQANPTSCDNQSSTPQTHNLIATNTTQPHPHPHAPPTTIYVQNYATATPIIVHPTENATATYMAKLTHLPPS